MTQRGWVPPTIAEVAKGASVRDLKEFYNYYADGICPPELLAITAKLYRDLLSVGITTAELGTRPCTSRRG